MAGNGHWVAFDVDDDLYRGLQRFMDEFGVTREDAARVMLRDCMVGNGYLQEIFLDEDSETDGEA